MAESNSGGPWAPHKTHIDTGANEEQFALPGLVAQNPDLLLVLSGEGHPVC